MAIFISPFSGQIVVMKKMTVRLSGSIFRCCKSCAQVFEKFEIISLFNMTADTHSEVCRFTMKEGVPVEAMKCGFITDLVVLRSEGRDYTCLVKGTFSNEISRFIRTYDLKLEYPIIFQDGVCTFGMVGTPDELNAIVNAARENGWGFEILSVQSYDPHISSAFNTLTAKQKEILTGAYRNGYFDHPRKIDAGKLAEKMGMHKTTLLEHVHKAEKRLIGHILEQEV
jgi:hypothetical protein